MWVPVMREDGYSRAELPVMWEGEKYWCVGQPVMREGGVA